MPTENKPTTKIVEVRLAALTRVEYTERVEVPADITAEELQELVNSRYRTVDGGEYYDDPEYWERGTCYATDTDDASMAPTVKAFRTPYGLHIERADEVKSEEDQFAEAAHEDWLEANDVQRQSDWKDRMYP